MNIHDFLNKIKGYREEHRQMLIIMAILAISSIASFYLGFAARAEAVEESPVVIQCPLEAYITPQILEEGKDTETAGTSVQGAFVASRNGAKYYPTGCSSVSRIKEENKVYFTTAAEAEAAGYQLTTACK